MTILKQAEAGTPVPELGREHGFSSASFYKWRSKFGGMDASLMARLPKNWKMKIGVLRKCMPKSDLKAEVIQEAMSKKVVRPSQRRQMARHAVSTQQISIRLACQIFSVSETCYRYLRRFL